MVIVFAASSGLRVDATTETRDNMSNIKSRLQRDQFYFYQSVRVNQGVRGQYKGIVGVITRLWD